jgi:Fuc2NAc and GlcNAc transferase
MALGLLIAGVGLRDDLRHVPARIRLLIQLVSAGCLLFVITPLPFVALPGGLILAGILLVGVGLLAVVWWINLFNFMDGIDGLAGMQAVFMLVAAAGLAFWGEGGGQDPSLLWWMLGLAASSGGFLLLNWPPASIFMGDVGSTYLGFMIAFFALATMLAGWLTYSTWLILAAIFLSDATVTLGKRLLAGERVYEAHRSHAYQRLAQRWEGHRPVVFLYLGVNLFWVLPLALASIAWPQWAWGCLVLAYGPLVSCVAGID